MTNEIMSWQIYCRGIWIGTVLVFFREDIKKGDAISWSILICGYTIFSVIDCNLQLIG